jgi:hypothetical protein
MRSLVALLAVALISFLVGSLAYLAALGIIWGERVSRGDMTAVLLWGGLAYGLVGLPLCLLLFLILHLVRRYGLKTKTRLGAWVLPLLGALLGLAPTYALVRSWGGGLSAAGGLAEPEALLFYSFFGASGACFGLGWWWLFERGRSRRST